jgi:hypothetical protein
VLAPSSAAPATTSALGHYLLPTRGLWVEFEERGSNRGYYTGQLLRELASSSVRAEVAAQLVHMRRLGVNEILVEMRSAGGSTPPPRSACDLSPELGPSWPQPTSLEVNGLRTLLGLAHQRGMRVALMLNNTHMEQQSSVESERWLGAVLGAVKESPALDYIAFGGDRQMIDARPPYDGVPDSCGGQSEAPLWLGPDSIQGRYVQRAIAYARSLGLPAQKLTAEAIVGDYRQEIEQGAGPDAQDRHLWRPLEVMRAIFDRLGIPASQRTYALSYYEHPKCAFVELSFTNCIDEDEYASTEETLRVSKSRVDPASRLTIAEWGVQAGEGSIPRTFEHFGATLHTLGLEGGVYWKWSDAGAADGPYATNPEALIKVRGRGYHYHAVESELADLYGFHVSDIPNGSFENGTSGWKLVGARSELLPLDEPLPAGSAAIGFLTCARRQSFHRQPTKFGFAAATVFAASPFRYSTPKDACFIQLTIRAKHSLDLDDIR